MAYNKSAECMNRSPVILDISLAEMGARPGPTTKALSKEGELTELSKPEYMLVTWVAITGEVNAAVRQDELEPVMASADGNVEKLSFLNISNKAARELTLTIAGPELTFVKTNDGTLDMGAVFSVTTKMMAGSEFSRAWLTPTAILLERDVEDTEAPTATATGAAEDDGAAEDVVKNRPADRLSEVEHSWVTLMIKPAIVGSINRYICSLTNPEKASYMKHPVC